MTDTNTAQLVVDLKSTDDAVRANGWVAPGLGMPGASLGLLGSTMNPLTGLATAGLGWFLPYVSFLGEGLSKLQGGNAASVTSGAQDFGAAGGDIAGVASAYRDSTSAQTSDWSGEAASEYRETGAQHADGIAGLGQASNTVGSAIIGAGQVVAQAIAEVTELIAEAVSQIVPIMTQAMARAGETFGESVAEAIPPCVGIAVEYALRIAAKLAALVASGDNLLKLVQGALAVVDLIQQALSGMSQQSVRADSDPQNGGGAGAGGGQQQDGGGAADRIEAAGEAGAALGTNESASSPSASAGGAGSGALSSGGGSLSDGSLMPAGSGAGLDVPTRSSSAVVPSIPQSHASVPDVSRSIGNVGGLSGAAVPSGAMPVGALGGGPATGSRVGTGRMGDTVRQDGGRAQPGSPGSARGALGGGSFGAMGGAMGSGRGTGEEDKEHQRKYRLAEVHDEEFDVSPAVITGSDPED